MSRNAKRIEQSYFDARLITPDFTHKNAMSRNAKRIEQSYFDARLITPDFTLTISSLVALLHPSFF